VKQETNQLNNWTNQSFCANLAKNQADIHRWYWRLEPTGSISHFFCIQPNTLDTKLLPSLLRLVLLGGHYFPPLCFQLLVRLILRHILAFDSNLTLQQVWC